MTTSLKPVRTISVAVVGVGLVGAEFVPPHPFRLISLSTSKASLASLIRTDHDVVLVDNTSAESVAETYPALLRAGVHIVTPNKKAFSGSQTLYDQIVSASFESGAKFLHESTVGAGLPVISTLKDLVATGDKVIKIEGVFSGTLSYIFNEFSTGSVDGPAFSTVVRSARDKGSHHQAAAIPLPNGYASVPTLSLVPPTLSLSSVPTGDAFLQALQAHDSHFAALRAEAAHQGPDGINGGDAAVLRYVGVIDADVEKGGWSVKASLERYPTTHPFATSLGGSDNIIMFHTERYGARPLIIQGAGAGPAVTAMGVLSDLLKLA
ncbi:hypothetical protein B0F90DRAFT_1718664 [Multifurca ochricompacta]|uniref:homoserine dehydrogenase n=1 Tax=Multifurca ochricompacta TaxID=376703 RepID=A0AAD4M478_9AGAM|nr:hypothetical protein B0F90DRAFT_1718664 [Multifurca ochricompacta]